MNDLEKAIEEWKEVALKITPEDLKTKEKNPVWYIYRNPHETRDTYLKLARLMKTAEDDKTVMKACLDLWKDERTNGDALTQFGYFAGDFVENLEKNDPQYDEEYTLQVADLLAKLGGECVQAKFINDTDIVGISHEDLKKQLHYSSTFYDTFTMREDTDKATEKFFSILSERPEINRKLCEKYIKDPSVAETTFFRELVRKVIHQEDKDFVKKIKQQLTSKEFKGQLGISELVTDINFRLLAEDTDNKELRYEIWERIKPYRLDRYSREEINHVNELIRYSAKDGAMMRDIAEYLTKQDLQDSNLYSHLINIALENTQENEALIRAFANDKPVRDVIRLAQQNSDNKQAYNICVNGLMQRLNSESNSSTIIYDVIKIPEISQHILNKMNDKISESGDKTDFVKVMRLNEAIIRKHPENRNIVKSVLDVSKNLVETGNKKISPEIIELSKTIIENNPKDKNIVKPVLNILEKLAQSSDEKTSSSIIELSKTIIENNPTNKDVVKSVLDISNNLAEKGLIDSMQELDIFVAAREYNPRLLNDKEQEKFENVLENDFRRLLKEGKVDEAIDKLTAKKQLQHYNYVNGGYVPGDMTYMFIHRDQLRRVHKEMDNGCIAVGYLCEDREWKRNLGFSQGIEWRWYAEGLIIDPVKADIVKECSTGIITVRDPYDARKDIYRDIDMENFMRTTGNKVEVFLGRHASASTEYEPTDSMVKEGEVNRKIQEIKEKIHAGNNVSSEQDTANVNRGHSDTGNKIIESIIDKAKTKGNE